MPDKIRFVKMPPDTLGLLLHLLAIQVMFDTIYAQLIATLYR